MKRILSLLCLTALIIWGCSRDYEILQSYDSVILTADKSYTLVNNTITFSVKDNNGTDHTAEATFYVDGTKISGNTLTSANVQQYNITASLGPMTSEPITVSFGSTAELNFKKRVLIEDYTGTWCGYCTRVAWAIELVKGQTENVVPVAIHRPSSNPSNAQYDPYNYDASAIENTLSAIGYPKGYLNRRTRWTSPEPNNLAQVINLSQGDNPKLGLAMKPTVQNGKINLDVNVMFSKDFSASGLRLVVYVLENGLLYPQHNYTEYYNGVSVIEDWVHNHVLRSCLTDITGETVPAAETTLNNVYTRSFSVNVPDNVTNASNMEFVAFIINENGRAVNVRSAHAGENQEFEIE
ncbi:MAG: Omp28-related outer membrane protein [Flavobacterium sp.]